MRVAAPPAGSPGRTAPGRDLVSYMARYIASIDRDPPLSRVGFADADTAIGWAREHAGDDGWLVGEVPDDGPPRIVTSELPVDLR